MFLDRAIFTFLFSFWLVLLPAAAQAFSDKELMSLSLEELMDVEVSSVGRKLQTVSESAAAVFVISQDDIRRSGVTSIPEALRMVPGLSVARIDGSKWAISSRGLNGRFANNKMLVLIDGRSVYSPLFSSVYWDVQDTLLDDIERIEIVRGPGAALWGANAVNGVINVITKNARDTQGLLVKAGYGTEEEGFAALRYGARAGDRTYYRAFLKYFNRDQLQDYGNGTASDDWRALRGGFRIDSTLTSRDELTLVGEVYNGTEGQQDRVSLLDPTMSYRYYPISDTRFSGGHLLARWQRHLANRGGFALQFYFDHTFRDEQTLLKEKRDTFDVDFQHRFFIGERHDLLWGLGYRLTSDELEDGALLSFEDDSRSDQLLSVFVQDEICLVPERLRLLLGSKFEYNDYTGFEYQPNLRLIWTPNERHVLWGAVSRAVRTPSRLEDSGDTVSVVGPTAAYGNQLPLDVVLAGSEDYEAEKSLSYELGYRYLPSRDFSVDAALFLTRYRDLRSGETISVTHLPGVTPFGYFDVAQIQDNKLRGKTYGLEVFADWRVRDWWRLQGSYSLAKVDIRPESDSTDDYNTLVYKESTPQQQCSLRTSFNIGRSWELDLWLRYVDRITVLFEEVPDYFGFDVRMAWQPSDNLELALVGQNLLDGSHVEFSPELGGKETAVPRGFYAQLKWLY